MMTTEKLRKLIGPKASEYSEAQLEELKTDLYQLAYLSFEHFKRTINKTLT